MPTIWITGGKGFIGRHFARFAASQGHRVVGIGHGLWPAEHASAWSFSHWSNGEIEAANLSQLARIAGLPEKIYHLAGGSSVSLSFHNPHEDFARTVETTARLLEWVRLNTPDTGLVSVSSAAVYGAGHTQNIAESAPVSPYSPYGFHKVAMETLCRSYGENFGISSVVVRLFSVYGAGLEKQLVWDLCSKLATASSDSVALSGTGNERRDWLNVSDAVELLWLVRDHCSTRCSVINGGTGVGTSTAEIAHLVRRAWGTTTSVAFSGIARRGDPVSLVADISRAQSLGFRPAVKLEDGVLDTVRWFKSWGRPSSV